MQIDRYRYQILSETIGGPDDSYHSRVFTRYTDSKGSTVQCQNGLGNPAIEYEYFT
jgi:hypothetical protein